ncbi:endo-1,4-beta-xylanase [Leadbettera azotonutricia]|uniref:Beta-xylanase n=1 Tax=Leadbettera azotonutricia (strain ATCC BAA-888 / DSM 13862 / ZAS-9) TaxID=545695 RepID=F5YDP8_LEAAZ|nr:endo-1,4-beta-xylanase [Leadbettera azotonutricia]AEF82753.1 endo-1,4-beta-xylanase A (Xylanase A) (1,4-beta-D-xylan xylanohydrolase A) [Leadbettera azotonutricia ZAS-9]
MKKLTLLLMLAGVFFSSCSLPSIFDTDDDAVSEWHGLKVRSNGVSAAYMETYEGKDDVLKVAPPQSGGYTWAPVYYDLSAYKGKLITVDVSFEVYIKYYTKIVWQAQAEDEKHKAYPVIAGSLNELYTTTKQWFPVQGSNTFIVDASEDTPLFYLEASPQYGLNNQTIHITNFSLAITVNNTPEPDPIPDSFVAVEEIADVVTIATAGTPLALTGIVSPENATNKVIIWSVKTAGKTMAAITGNTLSALEAGTVTITATVKNGTAVGVNYTKEFNIVVNTAFIAVTGISGVPSTATAGTPLNLTGTVEPPNATNKTIVWSISEAGTTGATISGNTLNTTAAGIVEVQAAIVTGLTASTNYTQSFSITINPVVPPFIAVTSISGVPTTATAGTPLNLTGTVSPPNATNKTIGWSVVSGLGSINDNNLSATGAGTVTVRASIDNGSAIGEAYTKDFQITASLPFVAVTGISGVPTTATVGTPLNLTGTVSPPNATNKTIAWSVVSGPGSIKGNNLSATGAGTVTVRASIDNGFAIGEAYTKDFQITASLPFVAVTSISGVPSTATVGTPLNLTGTVSPPNATNKTIAWSVVSGPGSIKGNNLSATGAGTVTVRASIDNGSAIGEAYTKDFQITASPPFVAVTSISGVPTTATVGTPLNLTGTVSPPNATNKTIAWSVVSGPGSIKGNNLSATGAGTVTVRASIDNGSAIGEAYTKDFQITASLPFVAVTGISGVPSTATAGTPLNLTGTVSPPNATNKTIVWSISDAGTTGTTIIDNTLSIARAGTVQVSATISNGDVNKDYTQSYSIIVNEPNTGGISYTSGLSWTEVPPLKDAYTNDFLIGNITGSNRLSGDEFNLLKKHYNVATPENDFKPENLYGWGGRTLNFDNADRIERALSAAGIKLHGHTLVWHRQTPQWMNDGVTAVVAKANLEAHVTQVVTHFKGKVISWDVVNEAFNDGLSNGNDWRAALRKDVPWYQALNEGYIELAFRAARAADPDAMLYYNDYSLDNFAKASAVANMVEEINNKYKGEGHTRNLIDGVGMQGHYQTTWFNVNSVKTSLELFISKGVKVSISELDIRTADYKEGTSADTTMSASAQISQGKMYAQLFQMLKAHAANIERVTMWGIDDKNSWLSAGNPCLFTRDLKVKQAFYGVLDPEGFLDYYK